MAEPLSGAAPQGHNRPPLGNMTQLQVLEFLDRYADADEEVKQALAARNQIRKDIEAAGCPKPVWDRFRKDREMSGSVRERYDAAYRQLMMYDRKPLTASADVANDPNADPKTREDAVAGLKRIQQEGRGAGKAGRRRDTNPYVPGTEEHQHWDNSWVQGQADIASTMGPGSGDENGKRRRGRPSNAEKLAREEAERAAAEAAGKTAH